MSARMEIVKKFGLVPMVVSWVFPTQSWGSLRDLPHLTNPPPDGMNELTSWVGAAVFTVRPTYPGETVYPLERNMLALARSDKVGKETSCSPKD